MSLSLIRAGAGLIFPPRCALCLRRDYSNSPQFALPPWQSSLCAACSAQLVPNNSCCQICALPLPATTAGNLTCGNCIKRRPRLSRVYAGFCYQGALQELIKRYKFANAFYIEPMLIALVCQCAANIDAQFDAVVAMPMHYLRLCERGFNHAEVMAAAVARARGWPLRTDLVSRHKHSPRFAMGASRQQRLKSIRNSFSCLAPAPKRILLVDDVMTTGASCNELARCLLANGCSEVQALVLARVAGH